MKSFSTNNPLIALKYDEDSVDVIRRLANLDPESVLKEISSSGKEMSYQPDPSWSRLGYNLTYDWSTGLSLERT